MCVISLSLSLSLSLSRSVCAPLLLCCAPQIVPVCVSVCARVCGDYHWGNSCPRRIVLATTGSSGPLTLRPALFFRWGRLGSLKCLFAPKGFGGAGFPGVGCAFPVQGGDHPLHHLWVPPSVGTGEGGGGAPHTHHTQDPAVTRALMGATMFLYYRRIRPAEIHHNPFQWGHRPRGRGSLHFHCFHHIPELKMIYGRSRGLCLARASDCVPLHGSCTLVGVPPTGCLRVALFVAERYLWSFRPLTSHYLPVLFVLIASCVHVQ